MPTVAGMTSDKAVDALRSAGFTSITPCADGGGGDGPGNDDGPRKVTGTTPAAGTVTGRGTTITLTCG